MIFADTPAATLRAGKIRKDRGNWKGYRKDPRPVVKINVRATLNRACRYDWLHKSIFGQTSIEQSFRNTVSNPDKIVPGYYFVTCTIDPSKSSLISGSIVNLDDWFRLHLSMLETPVSRQRRKTGDRSIQAPPSAAQLDQHHMGGMHMHMLIVPRNEFEAQVVCQYVDWWTKNHGAIDVRPIDSCEGVLKCLRYIYSPRPWHSFLSGTQFQSIASKRNLGVVSPRNLPRITEVKIVARGTEQGIATVPQYIIANSTSFIFRQPPAITRITSLNQLSEIHVVDAILQSTKGPVDTLASFLSVALTSQKSEACKQVLIDRLTSRDFVEAYFTIYRKGGLRKASKFVAQSCNVTDSRFAFRNVESLMRFGLDCGLKIKNSLGETRYEWDRNMAPIVGVRALTYEELRARIDSRNVA